MIYETCYVDGDLFSERLEGWYVNMVEAVKRVDASGLLRDEYYGPLLESCIVSQVNVSGHLYEYLKGCLPHAVRRFNICCCDSLPLNSTIVKGRAGTMRVDIPNLF